MTDRSFEIKTLPYTRKYLFCNSLCVVLNLISAVVLLILAGSKSIRPGIATAWEYAKIEIVPPMTIAFFGGPVGRQLENVCTQFADRLIAVMEGQVKAMDAAEAKAKQAKADAIKAAEAKLKAKAAEEAKKRQAEEKEKEEAKKAEAKKAEEAKKSDTKKTDPKKK